MGKNANFTVSAVGNDECPAENLLSENLTPKVSCAAFVVADGANA